MGLVRRVSAPLAGRRLATGIAHSILSQITIPGRYLEVLALDGLVYRPNL